MSSDDSGDVVLELADDDEEEKVLCKAHYLTQICQILTGDNMFVVICGFTKPTHRFQIFATIVTTSE